MEQEHFEVARLISGYIQGTLSEADLAKLEQMAVTHEDIRQLLVEYSDERAITERLAELDKIDKESDWENVLRKLAKRKKGYAKWIGMAAAVLLLAITTWWLLPPDRAETNTVPDNRYGHANDVLPGGNKAILTLADGEDLVLGDDLAMRLADAQSVLDIQGDRVSYRSQGDVDASAAPQYHQITVPVGGTYQVELSDGTRVWLNANSHMVYPAVFGASERTVKVDGEVYFEVAKDSRRPFIVTVGDMQVQALGTAFNINTHNQSGQTKTILTEGKIRVSNGRQEQVITPGQAVLGNGEKLRVEPADIEEALAWKDGYFYFDRKTMPEILDELARWYGVEVKAAELGNKRYHGGIKRSATLGTVCATLSDLSGKRFSITGKTLTVN
ncbi:FecR family protein [Parapedobacter sp. DT-150]|uniref:FecR family protein n=1 Tax=Parapedobacter sp. DT-150 TaxID=3396162 RepID=UPI003F1B0481